MSFVVFICYFLIFFLMKIQYVIHDMSKHLFLMLLCCFSVSDTSPYIVYHETKESEILCLPGQ